MRRSLFYISIILIIAISAIGWIMAPVVGGVVAGGEGGPTSFSDDFSGGDGDSMGSNWTEAHGDVDISSAAAVNGTSNGNDTAIHNTSLISGSSGYIKLTMTCATNSYSGHIFRYTDASTEFYLIDINTTSYAVNWRRVDNVTDYNTTVLQTDDLGTCTGTGSVAITWEGTGTDTVIRFWVDPSNNTPTAVDGWDDAEDTADLTFSDDPANEVDSGAKVGFKIYEGTIGQGTIDDFYAGDFGS